MKEYLGANRRHVVEAQISRKLHFFGSPHHVIHESRRTRTVRPARTRTALLMKKRPVSGRGFEDCLRSNRGGVFLNVKGISPNLLSALELV